MCSSSGGHDEKFEMDEPKIQKIRKIAETAFKRHLLTLTWNKTLAGPSCTSSPSPTSVGATQRPSDVLAAQPRQAQSRRTPRLEPRTPRTKTGVHRSDPGLVSCHRQASP